MMNPELQTLVDRLELLERQNRSLKLVAALALVLALSAVALPFVRPPATVGDRTRFSVVEANRFLLRDLNGTIAGGLEGQPDGSLRFVLGNRSTASAHLIVPRDGPPQLTLRAPDGRVQLGLAGSDRPGVWLSPNGHDALVSLGTGEGAGGEILLRDAQGRPRFHAP